jgi:hypothetical protein
VHGLRVSKIDSRLSLGKLGEHERSYAGGRMFAGWEVDPRNRWWEVCEGLSVQADPSETVVRRSVNGRA